MIEVRPRIKNLGVIDRYSNKIGQSGAKLRNTGMWAGYLLSVNVKIELASVLQDNVKNFDVKVVPSGFMTSVIVEAINVKGAVMYGGAKRHTITAKGKALKMDNGRYAWRVNHPGVKGKKQEINAAMSRAVNRTRQMVMAKILADGGL